MAAAVSVRALKDLTVLRRFGLNAGDCYLAGTERRLLARWSPARDFDAGSDRLVALKLSLATGGKFQVCLPQGLFHELLQGLEPAQFWQLDELLRCACLQVRSNGVLQWLSQRWQCAVRVDGVELPEHPPGTASALALRLRTGGGLDYPPALVLPLPPAEAGAGSLAALFATAAHGNTLVGQHVPLRLDVIPGHTNVRVAELRGLQVNDLIVPEAGEYSLAEAVLCMGDRMLFAVELQQGSMRVKQLLRSNFMADTETANAGAQAADASATSMPASDAPDAANAEDSQAKAQSGAQSGTTAPAGHDAPAATPELLRPEDVEVTLHFSLGSLTRTLAEINCIAEGDLLELPRDAADGVTILVNGKPLAQGEPVRIEERIGIRVVKVSNG